MDWGPISESLKASFRVGFGDNLDDIIEESTQDTNKVDCESDDQDEEVTRRSLACLVMTLLATTAAAVVCYSGFHPNSAINFNWKAMSSNMLGSPEGTVKQQHTGEEQELFEIAENVTAACGDFSQPVTDVPRLMSPSYVLF